MSTSTRTVEDAPKRHAIESMPDITLRHEPPKKNVVLPVPATASEKARFPDACVWTDNRLYKWFIVNSLRLHTLMVFAPPSQRGRNNAENRSRPRT